MAKDEKTEKKSQAAEKYIAVSNLFIGEKGKPGRTIKAGAKFDAIEAELEGIEYGRQYLRPDDYAPAATPADILTAEQIDAPGLNYSQLQNVARELGVGNSGTTDDIIARIVKAQVSVQAFQQVLEKLEYVDKEGGE